MAFAKVPRNVVYHIAGMMVDLKNASFHYALATVDLKNEYLFYDNENQLYRHFPKDMLSSHDLKKLSVREIIGQLRAFCRCDDPAQFNLLLSEKLLKKIHKFSKKIDRRISRLFCLCIIFHRFCHLLRYGEMATTGEIIGRLKQAVERHVYYLLGRKLSFTIFQAPLKA